MCDGSPETHFAGFSHDPNPTQFYSISYSRFCGRGCALTRSWCVLRRGSLGRRSHCDIECYIGALMQDGLFLCRGVQLVKKHLESPRIPSTLTCSPSNDHISFSREQARATYAASGAVSARTPHTFLLFLATATSIVPS